MQSWQHPFYTIWLNTQGPDKLLWNSIAVCHYSDVAWASWRAKPPKTQIFVSQFVQADNNENKSCFIVLLPYLVEMKFSNFQKYSFAQSHRHVWMNDLFWCMKREYINKNKAKKGVNMVWIILYAAEDKTRGISYIRITVSETQPLHANGWPLLGLLYPRLVRASKSVFGCI